jgi:hypothetical protein
VFNRGVAVPQMLGRMYDLWDSIGHPRGKIHGQHMHVSLPGRMWGRLSTPLPRRCIGPRRVIHIAFCPITSRSLTLSDAHELVERVVALDHTRVVSCL